MKNCQSNMDQSFQETYTNSVISRLGQEFPSSLQKVQMELVFDSFATLIRSISGKSNIDYTFVAAAAGSDPNTIWPLQETITLSSYRLRRQMVIISTFKKRKTSNCKRCFLELSQQTLILSTLPLTQIDTEL